MSRMHQGRRIGFLEIVGVASLLGGCDALSSLSGSTSADDAFVAVDIPEIGGADGLSAKAGIVESEPTTLSMPEDVLAVTPDDVSLTLRAERITVVVENDAADRRNPAAKGREHHASITFRMAERDLDVCEAFEMIGPFQLTVTDVVVTLKRKASEWMRTVSPPHPTGISGPFRDREACV